MDGATVRALSSLILNCLTLQSPPKTTLDQIKGREHHVYEEISKEHQTHMAENITYQVLINQVTRLGILAIKLLTFASTNSCFAAYIINN